MRDRRTVAVSSSRASGVYEPTAQMWASDLSSAPLNTGVDEFVAVTMMSADRTAASTSRAEASGKALKATCGYRPANCSRSSSARSAFRLIIVTV